MKITRLQVFTILVVIAAAAWEYFMTQSLAARPQGSPEIARVDHMVIVPVLLTLISLSIFQIIKKK